MTYQRYLQNSSQIIWVCISPFQLISSSGSQQSYFTFLALTFFHLNEEAHTNKLNMPVVKDSRHTVMSTLKKYTSNKYNSLPVLIVHESVSNYNDGDKYLLSEYLLRNYHHTTCVRYWVILSDIEKREDIKIYAIYGTFIQK